MYKETKRKKTTERLRNYAYFLYDWRELGWRADNRQKSFEIISWNTCRLYYICHGSILKLICMLKVLSRKIGIFLLLWPLVYYFLSLCIAVKNNRQQEMKCMEDLRRVAIFKQRRRLPTVAGERMLACASSNRVSPRFLPTQREKFFSFLFLHMDRSAYSTCTCLVTVYSWTQYNMYCIFRDVLEDKRYMSANINCVLHLLFFKYLDNELHPFLMWMWPKCFLIDLI